MNRKWRAFSLATLAVALLDQASKGWVRAEIPEQGVVPVLGAFFGLTHLRNPGTAFGMFRDLPFEFFVAASAVALLFVGSLLWRSESQDGFAGTALGLIVGGAIGNLVDRFYFREVVDFLRFDLRLFVFPPFNLADTGIVLGAGLLLLDIAASEATDAAHDPSHTGRDDEAASS